jgi:hypothetical protein
MKHCCNAMNEQIVYRCVKHPDPYDCPDNLVTYFEKFDEYGIIVHDGGTSVCEIAFCPWCGARLPESKRDRWFEELNALGFDNPAEQAIPVEFTSDAWFRA